MTQQKLKAIKINKSAGPDGISPKLLKLAETAIVRPLTRLVSLCAQAGGTFNYWEKKHGWSQCLRKTMQLTLVTIEPYLFSVFRARSWSHVSLTQ